MGPATSSSSWLRRKEAASSSALRSESLSHSIKKKNNRIAAAVEGQSMGGRRVETRAAVIGEKVAAEESVVLRELKNGMGL